MELTIEKANEIVEQGRRDEHVEFKGKVTQLSSLFEIGYLGKTDAGHYVGFYLYSFGMVKPEYQSTGDVYTTARECLDNLLNCTEFL